MEMAMEMANWMVMGIGQVATQEICLKLRLAKLWKILQFLAISSIDSNCTVITWRVAVVFAVMFAVSFAGWDDKLSALIKNFQFYISKFEKKIRF